MALPSILGSFIKTSRGSIANIPVTFAGNPMTQASLQAIDVPYLSSSFSGIYYNRQQFTFSSNVFNFDAKTLRFFYRPYFTLTDDFQNSNTELEAQTSVMTIYNNNTGLAVSLAPDLSKYANLFKSAAWEGFDARSIIVQGAVPFEAQQNDNLDITFIGATIAGGSVLAMGKALLQLCDYETSAWKETVIQSLIAA